MAPLWEPGTSPGEVVHRIAGRTVGQFFAEEIAKPLGLLDLWIGLPATEEHRVADQCSSLPEAPPQQARDWLQTLGIDLANPILHTMLASSSLGGEEAMRMLNSREGHAAEMPSANGIGNARSLAKFYAALIGDVDGVRLLQPDMVERARVAQTDRMTAPGPLAVLTARPANLLWKPSRRHQGGSSEASPPPAVAAGTEKGNRRTPNSACPVGIR